MGPQSRTKLGLGALVAAAVHCGALELTDRHLFVTFDRTSADKIDVDGTKDLRTVGVESSEQEKMTLRKPDDVGHDVSVRQRPLNEAKPRMETWPESKTVTAYSSEISIPPLTTPKLSVSSISTEIPLQVPVGLSTAEPSVKEDSRQTDTVMATAQRSYGLPDTLLSNVQTDASARANASAVDDSPEEATVLPLITPTVAAIEGGSVDSSSITTSAGKTGETTTLSAPINSNGSKDTGTVSPANESEGTDATTSPGQVHANSSADVRFDESLKLVDTKSSDSFHFQVKKEVSTTTEDYSARCSTNCSESNSREKEPSSDTAWYNNDNSSNLARGLVNPGKVTGVNTSSALYYNMDTGSIVAIVGVIVGIVGLLVLFAVISRKKDTDEDDDSLFRDGYNMENCSIVRHLPTLLKNDSSQESGNNDIALTAATPAHQSDGVSFISDESSDEVPPLCGPVLVANHSDDTSGLGCNRGVDTRNVRMSSLFSTESSMTSDSEISGSWSSVLVSDRENCTSRNTRDTSFSAWSATNLSPFESTASSASRMRGIIRSSSTDYHQTDGSKISRFSPRLIDYSNLPDEESRIAARPVESNHSVDSTEV